MMAFLALVVVGVVMYMTLPVSLLPDIAIPQITVQVSDPSKSAREIDDAILGPVRKQLMQVRGLEELKSVSRDGSGIIMMRYVFGTNTDYAYIEVNEKIDGAMNRLSAGTQRPKAVKASATDIPVFYVNVSQREETGDFLAVCDAVENIIRRRIEQLPEVAIADVTGVPSQYIQLTPDLDKMKGYGLTIGDIESALKTNNVTAGSMRVRDGVYEYTVKVSTLLSSAEDVASIYLRSGERILQLSDVCGVEMTTQEEAGLSMAKGRRVVTLAVIKQADESMEALKGRIGELVKQFEEQFPELSFEICRDQTELLDYTISNLKQNLILGLALIIVVAMLFMGGVRMSVIIGLSMAVSIIITFIPFYIFGRTLNIVSLCGLILVVGMMIDNALIVSENIAQWQQRGRTLRVSCVGGTRELITPLLSSSLTTVAVFAPLVFIDGIAGALFSDQAFAIATGLGVSYFVGIILIPVVYRQIMAGRVRRGGRRHERTEGRVEWLATGYDRAYAFALRHKIAVVVATGLSIPICLIVFNRIGKDKMPEIDHDELMARIEWNDEIGVGENRRRTEALMAATGEGCTTHTAYVGVQDYMLDASNDLSQTEAELYWKVGAPDSVAPLTDRCIAWLRSHYPSASVTFSPPVTIFERLFTTSDPDVVAEIYKSGAELTAEEIKAIESKVRGVAPDVLSSALAFKSVKVLTIDRKVLQVYNVPIESVVKKITDVISGSQVTMLHSYSSYLPVCVKGRPEQIDECLRDGLIEIKDGYVPIRNLVRETTAEELKTITAGLNGEYILVNFYGVEDGERLCRDIRNVIRQDDRLDVSFSGSFFGNQKIIQQLLVILAISIMLMYFILCSQFESFVQPLIVLVEIPIDAAFGLLVLWGCGETLNLMSGIGIIVSCGIVVNDSILKIDTINELRKSGMALLEAVHTAGRRRLRAIVMTSLTTIGAVLPVLFTTDMGSELQRPLAVAMIATMTIGTVVSLFVVPLIYIMATSKSDKRGDK